MIEKSIDREAGWNTSYLDTGVGDKAVILLHGFPDSPASFFQFVDRFSKLGYRCIVPYLPGYHRNHSFEKRDIYVHDFSEDLRFIIEHEQLGPVTLVASDWGAQASVLFCGLYPNLCKRLVLLGYSKANIEVFNSFDYQLGIFHLQLFQTTFIESLNDEEVVAFFKDWVKNSAPFLLDDHPIFKSISDLFSSRKVTDSAINHYRTRYKYGESQVLDKDQILGLFPITVPTLAIHGTRDRPGRLEAFKSSATDLVIGENAKKLVIDKCGHFPHLERPDLCWTFIRDFINE